MKQNIYHFVFRHFPRLWFLWSYRIENEYQNFIYNRHDLAPYGATLKKHLALAWLFRARMAGKTFLDLGCDTGFFALMAAMQGATEAVGVDRNRRALAKAEHVRDCLGLKNVHFLHGAIPEFVPRDRFDTVLFLSTVQYMFSDKLGNRVLFPDMGPFVEYLAGFVKGCLLVEFVRPEDPNAVRVVADRFLSSGEYSETAFVSALEKRFHGVENLGPTHCATRVLYLAHGEPRVNTRGYEHDK